MTVGHCIVSKIDFKIDSHLNLCTDVPPPSQKIGEEGGTSVHRLFPSEYLNFSTDFITKLMHRIYA